MEKLENINSLIVLDLDNTLIFGTSDPNLSASILFRFSPGLIIYERPNAKELVRKCNESGDVVVFTTAEREYAKLVCEKLNIKPIELFTREDCLYMGDRYVKSIPSYYYDAYDLITIVDDIPSVWDQESQNKCLMIQVPPFTGNPADDELIKIVF